MSNLGAIFVGLIGQAAKQVRLWCWKCNAAQMHARAGEGLVACVRCGNVQEWTLS